MSQRQVVQFVVIGARESGEYRERLYARANDGTLWRMDDSDMTNGRGVRKNPKRSTAWLRLPALPRMTAAESATNVQPGHGITTMPGYGVVINNDATIDSPTTSESGL